MPDYRFKGQRREIAVALNGRKRTLYETAKALGRRSGDIQKVLRQMHAEGILGPEDEEPTRGTEFWLKESYADALEDALQSDQLPGMVGSDQHILLLKSAKQDILNLVLSRADLTGGVAWAARIGSEEMLIAISPEAGEPEINALHSALEAVDIDVSRYRAMAVTDGEAMRRNAIAGKEASRDLEIDVR
jgi:hypothetical protein